ncbi:uncharacterized protein Z520_04839 [Fonsecaea multimorphosa CBS 102226]|uniref:Zn(2)-C6 fungal-type domain-containing protein n=1 Tax=Fonsecaea multimorphosa CBS 102226 TaxID=1442371 RepID=A0A0D2KRB8_9EURO|nr:uncharacterized protein Z520_04839 [Fonsecaea multimorphosa CBS 102226]KIX99263.1 hypothetical protein Z520_04839 [Fonsecaea multimorphosa CBS 102226]
MQPATTTRHATHPTACRTCRRRGRKCDKTLPLCQSCKDRSVVCEGYVTRWTGVAARGKLRGKTIPILVDEECGEGKRLVKKQSAVSTTKWQTPPPPRKLPLRSQQQRQSQEISKSSHSSSIEWDLPGTSDDLDTFIDYFTYELSGIPYLGSEPEQSPYLLYVRPLTNHVPPLRYVVAASAASHLAIRFQNDSLKARSRQWQLKAMELMRQRLASRALTADFGTVLSILMMAQMDMCTGDCAEFDTHIPAARAFVDEHGSNLPDRGYCEQRLAWLDIMRSTTSDRFLTFTSPDLKKVFSRYRSAAGHVREWGNEAFACPIDLLEYIVDVTVLYKIQPRGQLFSPSTIEKASLFLERVCAWTPPSGYYSEQMGHVVKAWHAGVQLYVIRLFQLHHHHHHRCGEGDDDATVRTAELVETVLAQAKAVKRPSAWSHASVWPLFQAGLWLEGAESFEQRQWLMDFLQMMTRTSGCRQLDVAASTLKTIWKSGEYYDSITAGNLTGALIL